MSTKTLMVVMTTALYSMDCHCRYLEHRGTHRGNARQDAIYSERFDQIEQAFYLFGFSKPVRP